VEEWRWAPVPEAASLESSSPEPEAWSPCVHELPGRPRVSAKCAAPVGGTRIPFLAAGLKPGPRNGPVQWLTEPCECTCHSQPGGSRQLGDLSPLPHCKRRKRVTLQLTDGLCEIKAPSYG
jgi:hypothetical protein